MKRVNTDGGKPRTPDFSRILRNDFLSVINGDTPIRAYAGAHILVTGASGFIGSLLIRLLLFCNEICDTRIRITAVVKDMEKAKEIYGEMASREDLTIVEADLLEPFSYEGEIDYIFHLAAVTASEKMMEQPVETILTSVEGTDHLLRLAAKKRVRSFVYLSSAEVYGTFPNEERVTEENLGFLDLKNVRSGYPESKRMCENLCAAYRRQHGVNVVIARPAQIFGAGILPGEKRVFSQFATSVIRGTDIVLHTKGGSSENFCYSMDCIRALLILGVRGNFGEAYNIVNEDAYGTVAEMAGMVAEKFGHGRTRVVFDIPERDVYGYPPETKLRLSGAKMRALGWQPRISLEEAYRRLIAYMKETGF